MNLRKKVKQDLKKGRVENFNRSPENFLDMERHLSRLNGMDINIEYAVYRILLDFKIEILP